MSVACTVRCIPHAEVKSVVATHKYYIQFLTASLVSISKPTLRSAFTNGHPHNRWQNLRSSLMQSCWTSLSCTLTNCEAVSGTSLWVWQEPVHSSVVSVKYAQWRKKQNTVPECNAFSMRLSNKLCRWPTMLHLPDITLWLWQQLLWPPHGCGYVWRQQQHHLHRREHVGL